MKTISLFATLLVTFALGAVSVDADKVQLKRAARLQTCEKKTRVLNKKLSVLKSQIQTALSTADDAMAVDCVETGNTAADCTADCTAVAVVDTTQSGKGAACLGDHACLAGEGACPADVDCVETGNTAAECTADCTAVAVVDTAQSGKGAACLGDHACLAGEGACPAANTAYCVHDYETNCASDKMITTQQECELCAEYLNLQWFKAIDWPNNMPGCSVAGDVMFNVDADATGTPDNYYDTQSYLCKA